MALHGLMCDYDQYKETRSTCNTYTFAQSRSRTVTKGSLIRNYDISNISLSYHHNIKLQTQKNKMLIVISDQFQCNFQRDSFTLTVPRVKCGFHYKTENTLKKMNSNIRT